ncbi:MAG TPA: hypothetical protein VI893_07625 [Thermoplasmata archaeon]|nr:hypothetical protein [Thermoplasmata archaeon]
MTSTFQPSERAERTESAGRFRLHVVSYKLGATFHATVDNVDPGAVVARAEAATREAAEESALKTAREAVARNRVVG